ncbi:hypothetical protein [Paracraurococcus lichenis]|uniref:Molybdopterin oxidoreductase n=1 Tax=Paracraurococcus lichenis TaxID=3064888 RepID=A0ABT9E8Z8_9PROT|nr:hypothetical protein [Paracraurococcus sp. LOR1-02]MDO9712636.1 hypothetical protein [Paracraurococcus sp. LOR1-02]
MTMESTPRFLNGVFRFEGRGLAAPALLDTSLRYTVPADRRAQLIYLRAGNSADGLVNLVLMRAGRPMRMFPVGARGAIHVPLAVVEDIFPETVLELHIAAPPGIAGEVVVDLGLMEI